MKILLCFILLLLSLLASPHAEGAEQPNILLLLSDDQAWNGLSCRMHPDRPDSANRVIETPHLAKLASQGMRFSAAYSPASVCSPTRISLQTGKSPAQCGWTKAAPPEIGFKLLEAPSRKHIEADEITIAELLRGGGYATAHYGKWHLGGGGPEAHGYEESDGETGNQDAAPHLEPNPVDIFGMGERAANFMQKSREADRPFFIQMSYHALHFPENATKALVEKYANLLPGGNPNEIASAALSEDLDRGVGELLAHLDALGLAETTYVIYMADNGSTTRGVLRGGKGGVWEGGIRVPFLVRGPGVAPDSWCHERVVGYDLFPTFCEWAGLSANFPREVEGGSIYHLLRGQSGAVKRPREELIFHFPHYQGDTPHTALFLDQYKLIRFYEDHSIFLFDIGRDPAESNNLAPSLPEKVSDMTARMESYLREVGAKMPQANPDYDPDNPPVMMKGGKGDKRKKRP